MKKFIIILLGMITLSFVIKAQDSPAKFGKITEEELNAKVCPIDSNAHAYYIFDCGETVFTYPQTTVKSEDQNSNTGFVMEMKRHFRIKVLNESDYELGNVEIPLYVSGKDEERLLDIDAVAVDLENGKLIKSKFEKKNIVYEVSSKNLKVAKIPVPNVKVGTVIDVRYTIKSSFFYNLRSWQFQHEIPTLYSSFVTYVPEYFNYHKNVKGYFPLKTSSKQEPNRITISYQDVGTGYGGQKYSYTSTFDYIDYIDSYLGVNIPAFDDDDFIRTYKNYISEVEFELASTKFPNSPIKYYSSKWEDVIKDLLYDEDFGAKLRKTDFFDDFVDATSNGSFSKQTLMQLALDHVKNKIKWDEHSTIYCEDLLKKAYNNGVGNSADINLCLVGLLEKFGFESYPVVLSTQDNGFLNLTHPTISDFNYVIALVRFEGKEYLIDATEPLLQINQLPIRCLNDKGLIVKDGAAEWVDLMNGVSYKNQISFFMQMDSSYTLNGQYFRKADNYAAYVERLKMKSYNNTDKYVEEFQSKVPGLMINTTSISGYDTLNKPLGLDYNISLSNAIETVGDLIFITPFLFETNKQSPFKLEKRTYPVEFDYPVHQIITAQYEIPGSMVLETMPQSAIYTLPDKSAKYTYSATQVGNKIVITSIYSRNKVLYLPGEYDALKEFYRLMIVKQNEKIVLKNK